MDDLRSKTPCVLSSWYGLWWTLFSEEMQKALYQNDHSVSALFICMIIKAVHVEVVSELLADAFLAVLNRFFFHRFVPDDLLSNCNTTIVVLGQLVNSYFIIQAL